MSLAALLDVDLGGYRVTGLLGTGGTATVYAAQGPDGKEYAVKMLLEGIAEEEGARARFAREAEEARELDHPALVKVLAVGSHAGLPYYVMERIEGQTLQEYLDEVGMPPFEEAVRILKEICKALAYLHEGGRVHRDLKPANIFLGPEDRRVIVGDFGLVKTLALDDLTAHNERVGTPAYMSPEMFKGLKVDKRSDIYQLGILLFRLLTGEVPFHDTNFFKLGMQHMTRFPPRPRKLNPEIPEELEEVILRCLEKRPRSRYDDAGAMVSDLNRFLVRKQLGIAEADLLPGGGATPMAQPRDGFVPLGIDVPVPEPRLFGGDEPLELPSSPALRHSERVKAPALGPDPAPAGPAPLSMSGSSFGDVTGPSASLNISGFEVSSERAGWFPDDPSGPDSQRARAELGFAALNFGLAGWAVTHAVRTAPGLMVPLGLSAVVVARGLYAALSEGWAPGWYRLVLSTASLSVLSLGLPVLAGEALATRVAAELATQSSGLSWMLPFAAPYTLLRKFLLPLLSLAFLLRSIAALQREQGARALRELADASLAGALVLAVSRAASVLLRS